VPMLSASFSNTNVPRLMAMTSAAAGAGTASAHNENTIPPITSDRTFIGIPPGMKWGCEHSAFDTFKKGRGDASGAVVALVSAGR
jgi:hypothetical protein